MRSSLQLQESVYSLDFSVVFNRLTFKAYCCWARFHIQKLKKLVWQPVSYSNGCQVYEFLTSWPWPFNCASSWNVVLGHCNFTMKFKDRATIRSLQSRHICTSALWNLISLSDYQMLSQVLTLLCTIRVANLNFLWHHSIELYSR